MTADQRPGDAPETDMEVSYAEAVAAAQAVAERLDVEGDSADDWHRKLHAALNPTPEQLAAWASASPFAALLAKGPDGPARPDGPASGGAA